MPRYAENTSVSSDRSRAEIERTLERYGATSFMYGWQQEKAMIGFDMNNRRIKFLLPLPSKTDSAFTKTPGRKTTRTADKALAAWEQACRQRWRALSLVIKAKLEACEAGIADFDEEFMAHIVLPDGSTVGDFMLPQIEYAYENKSMPALLPE
jgi:hypothetical protein